MQIHLLGYSEATISRILDNLSASGYDREVVIVCNIEVEEVYPYCPPGIRCRKISWNDWHFDPETHRCLAAVMNPVPKKKIFELFRQRFGILPEHYINAIHPSATISATARITEGSVVEPGSVIASFAETGFSAYINRCCSIGHHATLGDYVMTGPGVHVAGHCRIGDSVKLGIGSVVFDHVSIGENTVVGGGSVVTRDLPSNVIAWGNPCKVIKTVEQV